MMDIDENCRALITQLALPAHFERVVSTVYQPLVDELLRRRADNRPLLVSIHGAQGTGKSTMTTFLKPMIESHIQGRVVELSLDDFYLTRQQREIKAQQIHPLLVTRGVPGTHDVDLLEAVITDLLQQRACQRPLFSKAIDDRLPTSDWIDEAPGVEVILFEGWCNHSPPQSAKDLQEPVNQLEANEDPQGVWRHYVNQQLLEYHQRIFAQADCCLMLQAPDFEHIFTWRRLQEQKLRARLRPEQAQALMDDAALSRFIQHYERISRHSLQHLPAQADILIPVAPDHSLTEVIIHAR